MSSIFNNHHHNYAYSKIDIDDPEDKIHRRAQFMIYKTLQEAPTSSQARKNRTNKKKKSSPSSYIRVNFGNLRVKVGQKIKKLKKSLCFTVSFLKIDTCRHVVVQLKTWKKFMFGKEIVSTSASAALPRPMLNSN